MSNGWCRPFLSLGYPEPRSPRARSVQVVGPFRRSSQMRAPPDHSGLGIEDTGHLTRMAPCHSDGPDLLFAQIRRVKAAPFERDQSPPISSIRDRPILPVGWSSIRYDLSRVVTAMLDHSRYLTGSRYLRSLGADPRCPWISRGSTDPIRSMRRNGPAANDDSMISSNEHLGSGRFRAPIQSNCGPVPRRRSARVVH